MSLLPHYLAVIGQRAAYDADADDWFARVEANGGSFALGGSFTADYTKTVWNNFILGLKSDGTWSLIDELGVFFGVSNIAGVSVKIKALPGVSDQQSNTGYVDGDLTPTGSSCGLAGDSSKYFNTAIPILSLDPDDFSMGMFFCTIDTSTNNVGMGSSYSATGDTDRFYVGYISGGGMQLGIGNYAVGIAADGLFYSIGTNGGNAAIYKDGAIELFSSFNGQGFQSGTILLGRGAGLTANTSPYRAYFVGRQIDHADIYARLNTAIAAFT